MRVGFIDFICDPGRPGQSGLSDVVWNMARAFAACSDEVHIAAPYSVEPPAPPGVAVHRFLIPPIGYRNIVGHGLLVLRAWQQLRRVRELDVVIAPEYLSTGLIAPLTGVPVVLVTPGNIYERIANGNPFDWTTTQVLKVAARSSARYCALVDAISEEMAWWWQRTGADPGRVVQIPYGVDPERFRPIRDARTRLGLSADAPIVVYVGRLSPEKQVDTLLGAIGGIRGRLPDLRLHLIGDGPQRAALGRRVHDLGLAGMVTFNGAIPQAELPLWYSAADAVVLPSTSEGLPRVMLEAMACGAPFVGTAITGVVDVIRNGRNGYIVPPRDEAALGARLLRLCADRESGAALGCAARATILDGFTWSAIVGRLRGELERRLARPGSELRKAEQTAVGV